MKKTITFQAYSPSPTVSDGIGWTFPFVMVDSALVGRAEENANKTAHVIRVFASNTLLVQWGLSDSTERQPKENHNRSMKLLFDYAKRFIARKLSETGMFPLEDVLRLSTYTETLQDLDPERIPDPLNHSFEIEIDTGSASIASTPAQRRSDYLKRLYDLSDGDTSSRWNGREIGNELGYDVAESDRVIEYLQNEGFMKVLGFGQVLSITESGIVEIENSGLLNPEQISHRHYQRILFLRKAHEIELSTNNRFVSLERVKAETGQKEEAARSIPQWLKAKGYLESKTMGTVSVSHLGKKFLEEERLTEEGLLAEYRTRRAKLFFRTVLENTKTSGVEWYDIEQIQSQIGFTDDEIQSVIHSLQAEGAIQEQNGKIAITKLGASREGALQSIIRFGQTFSQRMKIEEQDMEIIPDEIAESLMKFRADHPDASKTAFIMMRFSKSPAHQAIVKAIQETLSNMGIEALRADDQEYNDSLYGNILTYLHGCGFGIAVFERIEQESFNPNVSFEVGYMFGIHKPVCLLKEQTLKSLHADMIGKLYREFDAQDPFKTIPNELSKWLKDKGFA